MLSGRAEWIHFQLKYMQLFSVLCGGDVLDGAEVTEILNFPDRWKNAQSLQISTRSVVFGRFPLGDEEQATTPQKMQTQSQRRQTVSFSYDRTPTIKIAAQTSLYKYN